MTGRNADPEEKRVALLEIVVAQVSRDADSASPELAPATITPLVETLRRL